MNKNKIYLHIGFGRTSTTTLQNLIFPHLVSMRNIDFVQGKSFRLNYNLTSEEDLSNSKEKIGNISQKTPNNNKQTDQIKKEAEIIYDLKNTPTIKKLPKKTNKKIKKGDLLIQLASFNNKNKAIKAQKKSNIKNSKILSVKIGSKTYHKLVIGPFKNKSEGKSKLDNVKKSDYKDAFFYKFK